MFDIATTLMVQLVDLIIPTIVLILLFDLMGSLLFSKR